MAIYNSVLVTTDFSAGSLPAVQEGARIAHDLGMKTCLLYVVENREPPLVLGDVQERLEEHRKKAEQSLKEWSEEHLAGCEVERLVEIGHPAEVIGKVAQEKGVDLIVMASHGHGRIGQILRGSTTQHVLLTSRCPVLVVPGGHSKERP